MPNRVAHAVRYSGLRQTASPRFWLPREVRLCAPFFAPDQEIRSGYDPSLYADASSINVRADQTVELLAIEWLNSICRWERKRAATVPNTPLGYGDTDVRRPQAGQNCSTEPDCRSGSRLGSNGLRRSLLHRYPASDPGGEGRARSR